MEADRGLPRARPALDDERRLGLASDQAVLVGLDGRDDVAHAVVARTLELLEQEVVDGGRSVGERAVERFVADAGERLAFHAETTTQRDSVRIRRGGGVEGPCRRCLPVDDDHAVVVIDPAPPDVERILGCVEVEPAEAERSVGIVVAAQAPDRPRLDRLGRDVGRAGAPQSGRAPGACGRDTRTRDRGRPARREGQDGPSGFQPMKIAQPRYSRPCRR